MQAGRIFAPPPERAATIREVPALQPGTHAPDFRLLDADGDEFHLGGELENGPVVLTFFKASCPTCQYGLPFLDRLAAALEGTCAQAVSVCQESPGDAERFNLEFDYGTRVVFDTEESGFPVSNDYGLTNVPTVFLIEGGEVTHTSVSWSRSDVEDIAGKLGVEPPFRPGESVLPFRPG